MNEAFTVLRRAKQDAERRLREAEAQGKSAEHKLTVIRHAIRQLEQGLAALEYMYSERNKLQQLWNKVEEGNRNVHLSTSTPNRRRNR